MKPGNLHKLVWAGFAVALVTGALIPASAFAGKAATTTSLATAKVGGAAAAAESLTVFTIDGTAFPTRISAFLGTTGRLTLVSPEGITAPVSANGECTQDSATQISCLGGFVDAIVGDLKGGADTFTAAPALSIPLGLSDRPMRGGSGRDGLTGGAGGDFLEGGGGPDSISGNGATDLLRGGSGKDDVSGGEAADAIYGGGGADLLDGGPGRDLCSGGGGRDRAIDCTGVRKVP